MQFVTGVGGVFLKAKNPKMMAPWYQQHLRIEFGGNLYFAFPWQQQEAAGATVFSFFQEDSEYFQPSEKPSMINFRVKDLQTNLEALKKEQVQVLGEMQQYEYGKFAWIMDPEGNKIELWEAVPEKA
jgi:predicted enzyme related to lactoylglutathione lyase